MTPPADTDTDLVALAAHIEELYEKPTSELTEEDAATVAHVIDLLDDGAVRVAAPTSPGGLWTLNEWAKQAILLYFRDARDGDDRGRAVRVPRQDPAQDGLEARGRARRAAGHRALRRLPRARRRPHAQLRQHRRAGSAPGTMVDTWATVGSCAQIGRDVHLSGGVGIGGVLEPLQAEPVIVEDGCFVGSRCIVVEGVRVGREAVLGANVVLTASTPIIDVRGKEKVETRGEVPAGAIVVPGSRTKRLPAGKARLPCAYIIGERSASTDRKTSLNDALREHAVSV